MRSSRSGGLNSSLDAPQQQQELQQGRWVQQQQDEHSSEGAEQGLLVVAAANGMGPGPRASADNAAARAGSKRHEGAQSQGHGQQNGFPGDHEDDMVVAGAWGDEPGGMPANIVVMRVQQACTFFYTYFRERFPVCRKDGCFLFYRKQVRGARAAQAV